VLCGSRSFIDRAHRIRKQLGGGMRQAGVLAAAGVVALEHMTGRLVEDHARARRLVSGLSQIPGILLDPGTPYSNMVFFTLAPDNLEETVLSAGRQGSLLEYVVEQLEIRGVRVGIAGSNRFRLVTHYWIDDQAVDRAFLAFAEVLQPEAAVSLKK
jgi:threonine aldolase